jgi:2-keto-3-deoxy-L-rhamnonate aldolase RhmA/quercetin dioxygenase-like cupin family protein
MKTRALKRLRAKFGQNQPTYGLWVTLESATITEMAVALGIDWVVVDAEHGHLDWKEINEHVRAALRSDTVVLVRLAERSTTLTKRALDIGADGIVIPWVESVQDLEEAVRDCRYPTAGRRGIGGERATAWGQCLAEHTAEANEHLFVIPLIESVAAIPHVEAMCQVEGVDLFFFGPADFSSTAGFRGQWEGPGVAEQILQLKEIVRAAGKHCGVMTTSIENLLVRREQGFRMLSVGADTGMLLRSLHQALQAVQCDRMPAPSLDPADGHAVSVPLSQPPADVQPEHLEVISRQGSGQVLHVEPGVMLEALVGGFLSAKGITTGVVTMQPEAVLSYHIHPCSESITVLEGEVEVAIEGRTYRLGPRDNIAIPRWIPHRVRNPHHDHITRLHIALAMAMPERELVTRSFDQVHMPPESPGVPGWERITRFDSAQPATEMGPGVQSIDYFQASVMPGCEMSAGFIRLEPGRRLRDHVHHFDESVCVMEGHAQALVEGREDSLTPYATAWIPRGRVHSFLNRSDRPVDLIWVCADPVPEAIFITPGFMRQAKLASPS